MHGDAREVARSALELHTEGKGFHAVLSDMCHDTMGASVADVAASLDLCECAAKIAIGAGFGGPLSDLPDLPVRIWLNLCIVPALNFGCLLLNSQV